MSWVNNGLCRIISVIILGLRQSNCVWVALVIIVTYRILLLSVCRELSHSKAAGTILPCHSSSVIVVTQRWINWVNSERLQDGPDNLSWYGYTSTRIAITCRSNARKHEIQYLGSGMQRLPLSSCRTGQWSAPRLSVTSDLWLSWGESQLARYIRHCRHRSDHTATTVWNFNFSLYRPFDTYKYMKPVTEEYSMICDE